MKLDPEARSTLQLIAGLGLLFSQVLVQALGGTVSKEVLGAGLLVAVPEAVQKIRSGNGNGGGK